jgi:photosystem II stability/assembly factor-like uncharacterized protein
MKKLILFSVLIAIIALLVGYFTIKTNKIEIQPLKPFEDLHFMRNYPDFNEGFDSYQLTMQQEAIQIKNQLKLKNGDASNWVNQGPYNIGGRINTIAVNPGNDQIIYIGSVCGGIFKTTDGGKNWIPIFDEQAYLSISHIVVSPHDTNTIFVGTGDANISGYPWVGNGIYKSTDAGATWEQLGLESTGIVSKIAVSTKNPDIIYAATMGLPFVRDNNRGLYKTTDGGKSWNQVLFLSQDAGIIDMAMVPNNPDTIFVAGWNRIRNYEENIASGPESKIYRTFNGGETWDTLSQNLPTDDMCRIGLTLSAQDTIKIFAQIIEPDYFETEGIYSSVDCGQSWSKLETNGIQSGALGNFGWYFGKIRVNPFNKNQLFLLGVNIHRSEDSGTNFDFPSVNWTIYLIHADKHDLVFIDSSKMLLATDGGLYKSIDNGINWSHFENIPNTQFYRIAVDPHHSGYYAGGAQDNGTNYGTYADSTNWKHLFGGDGFQPLFDATNPDLMYAETQNGNLYYGVKNGKNYDWEYFDNGINENDRRSWDMPICQSASNPKVMYTGTYRIYKNNDAPNGTWEVISDDLTDGTDNSYHIISAVDASPFNENWVLSGSSDGHVHYFDSLNWINISNGLPERYVTCVRFSPNNSAHIFVCHSGYKANEFIPHLHFSENSGENWQDISGNLPQFAINSIVVLPNYNDSVLFVATDGGVYYTLDLGNTWERTGTNMPVLPVYDLAYDDTNHILVAGTFARSIMTFDLNQIIKIYQEPNAIEETEIDFTVYPNPANSFITIELEQNLNDAQIQITNMSGQIVLTQRLKNHKNTFDISHLPPGNYIASITCKGNKIKTQQIHIVR